MAAKIAVNVFSAFLKLTFLHFSTLVNELRPPVIQPIRTQPGASTNEGPSEGPI